MAETLLQTSSFIAFPIDEIDPKDLVGNAGHPGIDVPGVISERKIDLAHNADKTHRTIQRALNAGKTVKEVPGQVTLYYFGNQDTIGTIRGHEVVLTKFSPDKL